MKAKIVVLTLLTNIYTTTENNPSKTLIRPRDLGAGLDPCRPLSCKLRDKMEIGCILRKPIECKQKERKQTLDVRLDLKD